MKRQAVLLYVSLFLMLAVALVYTTSQHVGQSQTDHADPPVAPQAQVPSSSSPADPLPPTEIPRPEATRPKPSKPGPTQPPPEDDGPAKEEFTKEEGLRLLHLLDRQLATELEHSLHPRCPGSSPNCSIEEACSHSRLLVIDSMYISGFGGQMGIFINHLFTGLKLGRILVIKEPWHLANGCPFGAKANNFTCFFRPFSPCTSANSGLQEGVGGDGSRLRASLGPSDFYHDHVDRLEYYPEKYRSLGIPFFRAKVAKYFARFNDDIEEIIRETKAKIRWPETHPERGIIAVHLRRGDKIKEGFELFTLATYLEEVKGMQQRTGARHLFVSTDSPAFLEEILASPEWTAPFDHIFYLDDFSRQGDVVVEVSVLANKDATGGYRYGLDALLNTHFMSLCNYFVGTVHSNLGKMGLEWMYAHDNLWGPAVFLDINRKCRREGHYHPDGEAYSSFDHTEFLKKVWTAYREWSRQG